MPHYFIAKKGPKLWIQAYFGFGDPRFSVRLRSWGVQGLGPQDIEGLGLESLMFGGWDVDYGDPKKTP